MTSKDKRKEQTEARARLHRLRRERKVCTLCEEPAGGRAKCRSCADHANELRRVSGRQKELYYARAAAGVCVTCGSPSLGRRLCSVHAAKVSVYARKRVRTRDPKGAAANATRRKQRREAGLCASCGKLPSEKYLCDLCGEDARMRREDVAGRRRARQEKKAA